MPPDPPAAERRPTMKDVAARAGVSRALVSIVFRDAPGAGEETRRRVLRAAADLGYVRDQSARSLRTGRSYQLGVVFESRDDFHVDLLDAVYRAADDRGYELLLSAATPRRTQDRALETLVGARVLGVVVFGARQAPTLPETARDLPLVLVGHQEDGGADRREDVVRSDEEGGVRAAVQHLVDLGHTRTACLEAVDHRGGLARVRAYRAAVADHGLPARVLPSGFTQLAGATAAQRLLAEPDLPTAVIAANDPCAAGVLATLTSAGVDVPGRVSVVGFDGTRDDAIRAVDLTTVRQDVDVLAAEVVQLLVDRSEGHRGPGRERVVPTRLVVGATTGPAAG
ncbi:LacI family DNA-binding transcriptional regulator [Kineococcus sp. SYSU DK001]|uniref:LacI family DNA-binding transcriptional regulator n=1 Tax=Kineococcus sp. SYSU DK001 TaxID=3383122 RepID=UPI003D7DC676